MAKLGTILNWSVEEEEHHSTAMRVTPLAGGGMMTAPQIRDSSSKSGNFNMGEAMGMVCSTSL